MSNELVINDNTILALDSAAESGLIANTHASLFRRAALIATATNNLVSLLTKPVVDTMFMPLQGKKIGFKSDKVYGWEVVRDSVIEAVMTGVDVVGNEFNIIAGNCYITKEGMSKLLGKETGLSYSITPMIPTTNGKEALIKMCIEWTYNGTKDKRDIDFCIKTNSYMGSDAIIGKATRKARAWLLMHITGQDIGEGDADEVVSEKNVTKNENNDFLDSVETTAQIVISDDQIINAIGCALQDIVMYFKTLTGNWGIKKSISELGYNERAIIMKDPVKVTNAINKMKSELI